MRFLWATRGHSWGFRFLRTGGLATPLEAYDAAFRYADESAELFQIAAGAAAVRFPDPDRRVDRARRVIPHEFVLFDPGSHGVASLETARSLLWPLVADDFAAAWDQPEPPRVETS